ncbi:hypothetical protein EDB87DRAFT_1581479 [Lactarius vividus]|nr:hypothetical protein EDB87DRAFT_1581479 [Lactarius vividus]
MSGDEDLARAIALSLRESTQLPPSTSARRVVNNDEDDEEARFHADLVRAIAASKEAASPANSVITLSSGSDLDQATDPVAAAAPSGSAFLTERAQLEQERLARLKRLRGDSPEDKRGVAPPPQKQGKGKEVADDPEGAEVFWDGELRQTANKHVEPRRNGEDGKPIFRLSQIIGDKSQIELAIISTYALQLSWIYAFFSPSTPVVLVTQPSPSDSGNATIKQVLPNWIRATPFLRWWARGNAHEILLTLLQIRKITHRPFQPRTSWITIGATSKIRIWVQDVPRRPSPIPHEPKSDDFPSVLERVLYAINVAPAITNLASTDHPNIPLTALRAGVLRTRWDFSRVRPALVPSIAGKHEGWPAVLKSGHTALMRAVSRLNPQQRAVSLECQGSSIGAYSAGWLAEFTLSARGASPEAALNAPKSRRAAMPMPSPSTLKILFPTLDWVRGSVLGEAGGGTMFCRKSTWAAAKFPRNLFCESRSRRGRVLMHSKMIVAVFVGAGSLSDADSDSETDSDIVEVKTDQGDAVGYAYVGSHNFTPSAWGTLSGSGFTPVLNVTNYELGIVFPLRDEAEIDRVILKQMQEESDAFNGE